MPCCSKSFAGPLVSILAVLEQKLGVRLAVKWHPLLLRGPEAEVGVAQRVLSQLLSVIESGTHFRAAEVDQASRLLREEPDVDLLEALSRDHLCCTHKTKDCSALTTTATVFFRAINRSDLVFGVGPAGTGKTYLAMAIWP